MTKEQIRWIIKKANTNGVIKWTVIENAPKKVILTNDYDKSVHYTIEAIEMEDYEYIRVTDDLQGTTVSVLLRGCKPWDDYCERQQGIRMGIITAVRHFNYCY